MMCPTPGPRWVLLFGKGAMKRLLCCLNETPGGGEVPRFCSGTVWLHLQLLSFTGSRIASYITDATWDLLQVPTSLSRRILPSMSFQAVENCNL